VPEKRSVENKIAETLFGKGFQRFLKNKKSSVLRSFSPNILGISWYIGKKGLGKNWEMMVAF
jgi:hypothetical protein